MKRFTLLLLFLGITVGTQAQQTPVPTTGTVSVPPLAGDDNMLIVHGRTDETFENSPYIPSEGWQAGYFVQQNGKRFEMAEMRYDTYLRRIEYREGSKLFYPKYPVVSFGFANGDVFMNQFPAFDKHDASTFYQVLYGGNTRLLRNIESTISDVTPYNSATKIWHFNAYTTYYLVDQNGMLGKSKKLDDSLLKAFGNKQATIKAYIKTNNFKWADRDALKQLMQYYDTL